LIRILIAGDFSPQGRVARIHQSAPREVFGEFMNALMSVDLAIVNLEAPLCRPARPLVKTGPSLHGPVESAAFLKRSGFGLVCLANNHIMDYGADGLSQTVAALAKARMPWVGAGNDYADASKPFLTEQQGEKIAILNFAENEWSTTYGSEAGACPIDPVRNFSAIRDVRKRAGKVIVISHAGHERHPLPSPRMRELFRFYIDAGADAVVGHHTHCTSGHEIYKGKPVFYSVGNFLFDSERHRSGPWTQGLAVELQLQGDTVDFRIYHFNQCTAGALFEMVDAEESDRRTQKLDELNEVIEDPELLAASFSELVVERQRMYGAYLEPRLPRLIGAAQRRGWLPRLITRRHRRLLLNLVRCESHREMLLELLKRDAGHSQ